VADPLLPTAQCLTPVAIPHFGLKLHSYLLQAILTDDLILFVGNRMFFCVKKLKLGQDFYSAVLAKTLDLVVALLMSRGSTVLLCGFFVWLLVFRATVMPQHRQY